MIKLIIGEKGSGKTKQLVGMINESCKSTDGNVVCIEKGMNLTFDIDHKCRLIDMDEFSISGYDMLYGFIAGVLASNFDIQKLYIDGILQIGGHDLEGLGDLLGELNILASDDTELIITVSSNEAALPASVKQHI